MVMLESAASQKPLKTAFLLYFDADDDKNCWVILSKLGWRSEDVLKGSFQMELKVQESAKIIF